MLSNPAYFASGVASLLFGYLLGSIPFGLVITRIAGTDDIRSLGSGNIGATNVLRTGRRGLAAATLVCDIAKGAFAVLTTTRLGDHDQALLAGLGAFLGHLFPVWLKFRGGKGVATYLGVLTGLVWQVALGFAAIWIAVAAASRYSSLAALTATAATPFLLWFLGARPEAALFVLLTVFVWIAHRSNIRRLLTGTESRIGWSGPR